MISANINISGIRMTERMWMNFKDNVVTYGPNIIYAIFVFMIGLYVCRWIKSLTKKFLMKLSADRAITNFIVYAIYTLCVISLIITCLGIAGIPTISFVAVLSAAGFAIGLAFKETLSNVASGIIILFFKPFRVGDYIFGSGVEGTVSDIHIFSTILNTPDNKTIVVPNFNLTSDNVINYTHQERRRIDLAFDVAYNTDIRKVKNILEKIFKSEPKILDDPKPIIGLNTLGDNAMQVVAKPWVKTEDYWDVYYEIMEKIKKQFDENGVEIPFQHRVIYYKNAEEMKSNNDEI